jgi:retinol dehydrogenase 12
VVIGGSAENSHGYVDGLLEKCLRIALPVAQVLLSKNARVYIAARHENRAQKTIDELKEKTGKQSIFFLRLDLADLPSIKTTAEGFTRKETKLHTLYNNGPALSQVFTGVRDLHAVLDSALIFPPVEVVTKQGYDGQFGTNVLGA